MNAGDQHWPPHHQNHLLEVNMQATIIYGKSINPVVKDNARSRRQKRRRAEEVDNGLVASRIDRALGLKPEKQQYP
ncbi:hypothetical protein [Sodalis glossinidius]|uniref:hypothetical protein n=1 Tax=Sodalis glossinidius TaxID=63612 RepID=UPI001FB154A4|nr:hypothetical protein [Sodalis glossinidius]